MSDIVERLRDDRYFGFDMRCEAADEIERLRALLNIVRIKMKNQDRRESEEPLYRAICKALERK